VSNAATKAQVEAGGREWPGLLVAAATKAHDKLRAAGGLAGPFGGAAGDGFNRDKGSFAKVPLPAVPPEFEACEEPVVGEHWDLGALIAGFGPSYGP